MMFTQVSLYDYQLDAIAKNTGLTRLEVIGVLAEINKYGLTPEHAAHYRERAEYHEAMGRNIY